MSESPLAKYNDLIFDNYEEYTTRVIYISKWI